MFVENYFWNVSGNRITHTNSFDLCVNLALVLPSRKFLDPHMAATAYIHVNVCVSITFTISESYLYFREKAYGALRIFY